MMTFGDHVGEYAELYALGALEPEERLGIDRHLAGCAHCTREVGRAEAAVVALDDATLPRVEPPAGLGRRIAASAAALAPAKVIAFRPRANVPMRFALAASIALVVGLGGGVALDRSIGSHVSTRDEDALRTVAASHFLHASFTPAVAGAPTAKVLYARDRSWYYVIVDGDIAGCHVVARSSAGDFDAGPLQAGLQTSTLFVRTSALPRSLRLVKEGRAIATATLVALSNERPGR